MPSLITLIPNINKLMEMQNEHTVKIELQKIIALNSLTKKFIQASILQRRIDWLFDYFIDLIDKDIDLDILLQLNDNLELFRSKKAENKLSKKLILIYTILMDEKKNITKKILEKLGKEIPNTSNHEKLLSYIKKQDKTKLEHITKLVNMKISNLNFLNKFLGYVTNNPWDSLFPLLQSLVNDGRINCKVIIAIGQINSEDSINYLFNLFDIIIDFHTKNRGKQLQKKRELDISKINCFVKSFCLVDKNSTILLKIETLLSQRLISNPVNLLEIIKKYDKNELSTELVESLLNTLDIYLGDTDNYDKSLQILKSIFSFYGSLYEVSNFKEYVKLRLIDMIIEKSPFHLIQRKIIDLIFCLKDEFWIEITNIIDSGNINAENVKYYQNLLNNSKRRTKVRGSYGIEEQTKLDDWF